MFKRGCYGHLLYLFRAILSSDAKTRALLGTNVCLDICAIVQVTSIIVMYTTVLCSKTLFQDITVFELSSKLQFVIEKGNMYCSYKV